MKSFHRIWHTALWELGCAIRSRRALVILLLYLAAALLSMNGSISILGKMERELAEVLQLPASENAGVVSQALWKSKPFSRIVRAAVGSGPVLDDIFGRHPVELLYAWFAFLCAPVLAVLVCGTRVSDDLRSGAVRYMLVRESRLEWTSGKFLGQTFMIAIALAVSSLGAAGVAFFRLAPDVACGLVLPMAGWGLRAWIYSLAWIGLALGLSHTTSSPGRATAMGILAICVFAAVSPVVELIHSSCGCFDWILHAKMLVPGSAESSLWRFEAVPVIYGAVHLVLLGLVYLMAGAALFSRRDV
jgi:ABC-type transport system involved in multi-copper enzyme maturation permease subunit